MKINKKLLSLFVAVLAIIGCFTITSFAYAADNSPEPSITQKIISNGTKEESNNVSYGETYTYEITTQVPDTSKCVQYNGNDYYDLFIEDVITSSIRPDISSFQVKIGNDILTPNKDYVVGFIDLTTATEDDLMTAEDFGLYRRLNNDKRSDLLALGWISFNEPTKGIDFYKLAKKYEPGTPIVVTYNATITKGAINTFGNANYAAVEYSDPDSDVLKGITNISETLTFTSAVKINVSNTDGNMLAGQKFCFSSIGETNLSNVEINVPEGEREYIPSTNQWEITVGPSGTVCIEGLKQGQYSFCELSAPTGSLSENAGINIDINVVLPNQVEYGKELSAAYLNRIYENNTYGYIVNGEHDSLFEFGCVFEEQNMPESNNVKISALNNINNSSANVVEAKEEPKHDVIAEEYIDANKKKVFVRYTDDNLFYDSNGAVLNGWLETKTIWVYRNENVEIYSEDYIGKYYFDNGVKVTGWQTIDGYKYYFDGDKAACNDECAINGKWYYFMPDGKFFNDGWTTISGKKYYFDKTGCRKTGFADIDGKRYYFNSNGVMQVYTQVINGDTYYFNGAGVMQTGWIKFKSTGKWKFFAYKESDSEGFFYTNEYGKMVANKRWMIKNKNYFFDKEGWMRTGWIKCNNRENSWYYFNSDGSQKKGWNYIDGYWYYFSKYGIDYLAYSGRQEIDGKSYYFNSNAQMQTGWIKIGDFWYYAATSGEFLSGWQEINGKWYYFHPISYTMQTGFWVTGSNNEKLYYFGTDGAMRENEWVWHKNSNGSAGWIYLDSDGNQCTSGWKKIDGKWYYFEGGQFHYALSNRFERINGKEYYFKSDCSMATGTFKVNGYYRIANSDGALTYNGWKQISSRWYYFRNGHSQTGWISDGSKRYYCRKSDGIMYANTTVQIDGKACRFDSSGAFTGYGANGGGTSVATTK